MVSASGLLRDPDGVASLAWPDLSGSRLSLRTTVPGEPYAGDTLWADVLVINKGLRSATQAMAALSLTGQTLRALAPDPPMAGLTVDTLSNQAAWSGRVAWGDTVRFTVPCLVLSGNSFGGLANVKLSVQGGRSTYSTELWRATRSDFLPHDIVLVDRAAEPRHLGRP